MNRILILALCLAPVALAQDKTMSCDEDSRWSERGHYCEIREVTVPAGGRLDVDGGVNGGISIKGANRSDILVRSKVQAYQDDEKDSRRVAAEIHVETAGGRVHSPRTASTPAPSSTPPSTARSACAATYARLAGAPCPCYPSSRCPTCAPASR